MSEPKSSKSSAIPKVLNIECKNFHEYIASLPPDVMERLYNFPAICLAVYR